MTLFSTQLGKYGVIAIACCLLLAGLFIANRDVSYAELNYTEHSRVLGVGAGGVIPASCESGPPTNHFAGDCPPAVQTRLAPSASAVTGQFNGSNPQTIDLGASISWTSSGATFCISSWSAGLLPPSGSFTPFGQQCNTYTYNLWLRCSNGVFWSAVSNKTVSVVHDDYWMCHAQ